MRAFVCLLLPVLLFPVRSSSAQAVGDGVAVVRSPNDFAILRSAGGVESTFHCGRRIPAFTTSRHVAGDWDADGFSSLGIVTLRGVRLWNQNQLGFADVVFDLPQPLPPLTGELPLYAFGGDFDNDGTDTIGVYDSGTATFYLLNSNQTQPAYSAQFVFGTPGDIPVVGDWDGDGDDTVGTYNMASSQFSLRNSNDAGPPDLQYSFYPQHAGLMYPVVGDWDGNGMTTVGAYFPGYHAFALTDDPAGVQLSQVFYMQNQMPTLGLAAGNAPIHQPLSGNWATGQASVTPAAYFPTSTPAAEMINESLMNAAFDLAGQRAHTRSLVLVRNGKVVKQEYYHGFTADMRTNIKSESKSVLAILMIRAVLDGKLPSLNSNLATLLPSYFTSPGKGDITMQNLMNMASGLAYTEVTTLGQMIGSGNWVQFMSMLEFPHTPGTVFRYSTGNSHLGAVALQGVLAPESLDDYGQRVLFGPLGLNSVRWDYDPQFNPFGGAEMFMPARDQARLGQLLLDLPELEQILTTPGVGTNYGLWTRRGNYSNGSQECPGAYFLGHGGQITLVVPCWQVVIVINSNPDVDYSTSSTQSGENWTVVTDLLKAVM